MLGEIKQNTTDSFVAIILLPLTKTKISIILTLIHSSIKLYIEVCPRKMFYDNGHNMG